MLNDRELRQLGTAVLNAQNVVFDAKYYVTLDGVIFIVNTFSETGAFIKKMSDGSFKFTPADEDEKHDPTTCDKEPCDTCGPMPEGEPEPVLCGYSVAWVGKCKRPMQNEGERCPEHRFKCSTCHSADAVKECEHVSDASGFLCGDPLCDKCACERHR